MIFFLNEEEKKPWMIIKFLNVIIMGQIFAIEFIKFKSLDFFNKINYIGFIFMMADNEDSKTPERQSFLKA